MSRRKICQNCGALNEETAGFCGRCGTSLSDVTPRRWGWLFALGMVAILALAGGSCLLLGGGGQLAGLFRGPDPEISALEQPVSISKPVDFTQTATMAPEDSEGNLPAVAATPTLSATTSAVPSKTASPTPLPTKTTTSTPIPTSTATALPTATPTAGARFSTIYFCVDECQADGSNAQTTFPGGTTRLFVLWNYENIAIGAHYERLWYNNGRLWAHYECIWPGPTAGVDLITLTDPDGLHSGLWEMEIRIDGQLAAREEITLTGDHISWDPPGRFDSCYGKK